VTAIIKTIERAVDFVFYCNRALPVPFTNFNDAFMAKLDFQRAARPGDHCRVVLRTKTVEEITLSEYDET
jgi:hypothetical protein